MPTEANDIEQWFVLRDLKRANSKTPAYKQLVEQRLTVFTPMKWQLVTRGEKRIRQEVPVLHDLLFVHEKRSTLDPIIQSTATLQYRWMRDTHRQPMTVSEADMHRFVSAVRATPSPRYYLPEEVTPQMFGRRIRIVGGPLEGCEGYLQTTRGSKVKRLLVQLPDLLAVSVEVSNEYIATID